MGEYFIPTGTSRTNLGPLTTTWALPSSCSIAAEECATCTQAWRAQGCDGASVHDATDCWPPAASSAPSPVQPFNGWGFYSPGVACPSGYTSARTAIGPNQQNGFQWSLYPSETAVQCCPSGFSSAYIAAQTCLSVAGRFAQVPVDSCSNSGWQDFTYLTLPFVATDPSITNTALAASEAITISAYSVYAPMIEIRWQSSDLAALATSTSSSSTAAQTGGTAKVTTATPTGTASTATATNTGSAGLSVGAQAAIGVVVPVVVLGALAAGFFVWWRRRRQSRVSELAAGEVGGNGGAGGMQQVGGGQGGYGAGGYYPVDQKGPAEVHGQPRPYEIGSQEVRAELPGTGVPEAMGR